ncbi:hypothetical protein WJ03_21510 [Burkholderia vietnamiensis]|nr:hypothetical protein WJ03_21510 [Burkholderia vietnamiensis]
MGELVRLLDECERLYKSLSGVARLDCIEPNLRVTLTAQPVGHIDVQIDITPDHLLERHEFKESIDQSYLPAIISQCHEILTEYPVRDPKMGAD